MFEKISLICCRHLRLVIHTRYREEEPELDIRKQNSEMLSEC